MTVFRIYAFLKCSLCMIIQKELQQFVRGRSIFILQEGADIPSKVHWCAIRELTEYCASSTTIVGYDLVVSRKKLLITVSL